MEGVGACSADGEFEKIVRTHMEPAETGKMTVRAAIETARLQSDVVQGVLGHPDTCCPSCGTTDIPEDAMDKPCPTHGATDAWP